MTVRKTGKGVMSPLKGKAEKAGDAVERAKPLKGKRKAADSGVQKPKSAAPAKAAAKPRTKKATKAGVQRDFEEPTLKPVKFEKRFIGMARLMFLAKVSDEDIAKSIGIDVEELEWWKEEHPDFGGAFRPDPRNYGGRPSEYEEKFADQARMLAKLGATDLEIAQFFGKALRTIYRWKIEYPEFAEALQMGKDEVDAKVEESLYRRAVGYSFDSEKIVVIEGEAQRVETIEHVPPDTKAAMFWLQNRRPGIWRDTKHIKHDVEPDSAISSFLKTIGGNTLQPKDQDGPASKSRTLMPRQDEQERSDGI